MEKLSDSKERIRESARKGMEILASSANIGPAVGAHALRPLNAKQKAAWRLPVARLQILTELINQYGLGSSSGIMAPSVMKFAQDNGCFTHSNGDVRDATKDLTVAVQKHTGTQAIEPYLKGLRPKQLEEYEYAFGRGNRHNGEKGSAEQEQFSPNLTPPEALAALGPKAKRRGYPHRIRKARRKKMRRWTSPHACFAACATPRGTRMHWICTTGRTALFLPPALLAPRWLRLRAWPTTCWTSASTGRVHKLRNHRSGY